jgi:hypothetical protein
MVPEVGLEPTRRISPADFESAASTNFATPAGARLEVGGIISVGPGASTVYCPKAEFNSCSDFWAPWDLR